MVIAACIAIATSIHDKKSNISVAEIIVIVLAIIGRIIIGFSVVDSESIGCIRERGCRIITSTSKIVDDLQIDDQSYGFDFNFTMSYFVIIICVEYRWKCLLSKQFEGQKIMKETNAGVRIFS